MRNPNHIKRDLITAGFAKLSLKKVLDNTPEDEVLKGAWYRACYEENQALLELQRATSLIEACDFYTENVVKYFS